MAAFLKVLFRNLLQGPSTDPFPLGETFTPDRLRGKVCIDPKLCMGCGICAHYCVSGAIHIERREDGHTITVWDNICCRCATCRQFCPVKAITLVPDWHSSHVEAEKYKRVEQQTVQYVACAACGQKFRPLPPEIASRLYAHYGNVDAAHTQSLCPKCRQLEDARRNVGELPQSDVKAVE